MNRPSKMGNKVGEFLLKATERFSQPFSLDTGVSQNSVAQMSGHNHLKSLDCYIVVYQQQDQISKTPNEKENSKLKQKKEKKEYQRN